MVNAEFDPNELQGNILRGYRRNHVRYLMLEVKDVAGAKAWLGETVSGNSDTAPQITREANWTTKPDICFNLGVTYNGLQALGYSEDKSSPFPIEFKQGMHNRSVKLGDIGSSSPQSWSAPFDKPERIHLIASLYADDEAHLDSVRDRITSAGNGSVFNLLGTRDGANFNGDFVHFGYHDNISQPRFEGISDPSRHPDDQPFAPLGTVLLGHEKTEYEDVVWDVPKPDVLGINGCYNAFRILEQDVQSFEAFLDEKATELIADPLGEELLPPGTEASWNGDYDRYTALREIIASRLCGRWRNGTPVELSPDNPDPDPTVSLSRYEYGAEGRCPYGAHMRRCNPRGGHIVQRVANNTRRLVRRGIPYGPAFDPANPDEEERGLLGNFLGADLGAQFEAVMYDWLNLGLQDPRITGSNDPLLGKNDPKHSWFDIPLPSGNRIRLRGIPRFVWCRGGSYLFLPSIPAIRYLAS